MNRVAPGIFTANFDGTGVPSAATIRIQGENTQIYESVARFDHSVQKFVPRGIDLGAESEKAFLVLFGTGWRQLTSGIRVVVTIGGIICPIQYVGPQLTFEGMDQINVLLPRDLLGRGEVDVAVKIMYDRPEGFTVELGSANPVKILIN